MKPTPVMTALLTAGILASGSASALEWNPAQWFQSKPAASQKTAGSATTSGPTATFTPIAPVTAPNYRAIVERYGPAVVGINTEGSSKSNLKGLPEGFPSDPFFKFFHGLPGFKFQMPGDTPVRGQGSGFIVGKDGLILTNAHVVRDAEEVTVKLSDRREFKAKVLGSDTATDVAVLKISADNLPTVATGNSSQLAVGDYVLAIGAPFGFEQSATAGIVSAKGRSLPGDAAVPFIQTDVAVNPGNSGGPLFDANGAVVGINSQIYSRSGGYQGVSFAIPIDVALRVKDQIVATGKVSHARLGVTIQEVNQTLADSFKLKQPEGALVSSVASGSAAEKAGIEAGDIILKFNATPILRSGDLPSLVSMSKPGDKARLEVWRDGKKVELTATLGESKDTAVADNSSSESNARGKLGLSVRPLTPEERNQSKLASGLVVERASGPAARAGIETGDIIVSVNGTPVKTVEQLLGIVEKQNKHLAVLVQRGESRIFIPVRIG
jgi:serine protease Do